MSESNLEEVLEEYAEATPTGNDLKILRSLSEAHLERILQEIAQNPGLVLFTLLRTWRRGRELLRAEMQKEGIRLDTFLPGLMLSPPVRVPSLARSILSLPRVCRGL